jgi:glycosyltransferase involved in cell wall biosynthesis
MGDRSFQIDRHVLVVVQNLPVPLDRRVWLECQALRRAGYEVSVICPKGPGDPSRETIDGVRLYKYRPAPVAETIAGYVLEFAYSWMRTALLSLVAWRDAPFAVLQACNPPDTYWLLAALWRLRGVRFVYDQHDLNPELFRSRFGEPRGIGQRIQYAGLVWLERMTYNFAHRVISTNESYRRIATTRGQRRAEEVTVVRSGPDTGRMRPIYPPHGLGRGAAHLLAYIGIMGPQDDVDQLVEVMDELVNRRGRTDLHLALLGFGDCLDELRAMATTRGLDDHVTFTGRVGPEEIADYLSAAEVGLCPDLKTPLNDVSTMNKTMEYMAYCLPSVSFDLAETRVSAGDTALFVSSGDIGAFADAVERLVDDVELRVKLGLAARKRVVEELDWSPQSKAYVEVFDDLIGAERGGTWQPPPSGTFAAKPGRRPVADGLEAFVRWRGRPRDPSVLTDTR